MVYSPRAFVVLCRSRLKAREATGLGAGAALGGSGAGAPATDGRVCLQPGEAHFVDTLKEDVNGLNDYFIEREEDFVIRMEALVSQQAELTESDAERQAALRSSFIDLHGARRAAQCCCSL